jgi:glycerol-3-phosphate acyltransferase PlsY
MPDLSPTVLLLAAAYLIGSIPVAFLLVKLSRGADLRDMGSSNIGAMNAYEVTESRRLGISAGLLDGLKGFASILVLPWLLHSSSPADIFALQSITLIGVVAGHNYNVWLSISRGQLEGGKGLAAAGGGLIPFMAWLLPVWVLLYAAGLLLCEQWRGERNIIAGNVFALLALPLPAYFIYGSKGFWASLFVGILILPKHVQQVRDLLGESGG